MNIKMKQFDGWTWVYFGGLIGWSRTRPGDKASTNLGVAIAMLRAGNLGSDISTPKGFHAHPWKDYQMKDDYLGDFIVVRDEYDVAVKSVATKRKEYEVENRWMRYPPDGALPTESKLAEYYGRMLIDEWKREDEWNKLDRMMELER